MAQVRNVPPTHPTVYVGLGLSAVGLLLAVYAYTGARVYDILYAFVALVGGALALAGILTAAWGRAIMTARASRQRRAAPAPEATKVVETLGSEGAPTIAAPKAKRRFDFAKGRRKERPAEATSTGAASVFAFKRREAPAPAEGAVAAEAAPVALASEAAPAPERVTVRCPDCSTVLTAEGVRPITVSCPHCGFSDTI